MADWTWNLKAKRYQDASTGRFMARDEVLGLVQQSLDASGNVTDTLAGLAAGGQLAPGDWRDMMRSEIKGEYLRQYMTGRGGRAQMTYSDWGRCGAMLKAQYKWLEGFAEQVATGELSEAQIRARARLYVDSARQAYEKGNARALGAPDLPAYPGDGSTACLSNCQCGWRIKEVFDEAGQPVGWDCYWELTPGAEHCVDCEGRGVEWYPLEIRV